MTSYNQKPMQGPPLWDGTGKIDIGQNEESGYTHNNKSYCTPNDSQADRYNTVYNQGYYDKSRQPITEFGRLNDESVREPQEDGYTKSEKLHPRMGDYDVTRQLESLHPYVNRSLKARDPFYGENKYAHKQRSLLIGWYTETNHIKNILHRNFGAGYFPGRKWNSESNTVLNAKAM